MMYYHQNLCIESIFRRYSGWLLVLLMIPGFGYANFIGSEFGHSFNVHPGINVGQSSYDVDTDVYHVEGYMGPHTQPAQLTLSSTPGFEPDIADLIGSFYLTAIVDGDGVFASGHFSWVGGSETLGIAPGTELLSGTLSQVHYISASDFPVESHFQSLGRVDVVDPLFGDFVAPVDELLVRDYKTSMDWEMNPWGVDFSSNEAPTGGPDLFGRAVAVPEPAAIALLTLGVMGLWLMRKPAG